MLAGLDTDVLTDVRIMGLEKVLDRVLSGGGWTTSFVDRGFCDPLQEDRRGIEVAFPFVEVDPVDARLLPLIHRDQVAIAGREGAATGKAAGEVSILHVAREIRQGSIVLSNNPRTVALGRKRGISVRGTLYIAHRACRDGLLTLEEVREYHDQLLESGRFLPRLTEAQLDKYLQTGEDPR